MEGSLQELAKALECPCCYETPRPDTSVVGICKNGHTTCQPCGSTIVDRSGPCPVCRHNSFNVIKGHKLATSIIQILATFIVFKCKHDHCTTRLIGNMIVQHEKECSHKPIQCPRANCQFQGGLYRFLSGMHNCVIVCPVIEATYSWMFALNISYVYSLDCNMAQVSQKFKPIVLKGVTPEGFESCAYINIASRNDAILIYSGWLNKKNHMSEEHQNIKIEINAYVNSKAGRVGQFVSQYPKYEGEKIKDDTDGILLTRETLYNWSEWSCLHICEECNKRRRKPHMHLEVKISF